MCRENVFPRKVTKKFSLFEFSCKIGSLSALDKEFYADSLGQEFFRAISNALNPDIMRRAVEK